MADTTHDEVPWRIQGAVYGIGLFSTSIFHVASVILPLYVDTMSPSPLLFGLVFAAPHILPLLFSIHAGAMMDKLGARRVMLACTTVGAIMPLLYPAAAWIWMVVVLQMVLGLSESMGWLGAQTMIGQYMHGRTSYAGRLSVVIRIGQLAAPPMAGAAWDLAGPWGGFTMMSLWASGSVVCAMILPSHGGGATSGAGPRRIGLRDIVPDPKDYVTAFRLLAAPAVTLIVLLGSMMHMGNAVQRRRAEI